MDSCWEVLLGRLLEALGVLLLLLPGMLLCLPVIDRHFPSMGGEENRSSLMAFGDIVVGLKK